MDWLQIFLQFGLPTGIVIAIGWFVFTRVWPFVVKAWENQVAERKLERAENAAERALEREQHLKSLEKMAGTIDTLTGVFNENIRTERETRMKDTSSFLNALNDHKRELGEITRTQKEIQKALGQTNGKDKHG